MSDKKAPINWNFDLSDATIHEVAASILLSKCETEFTLIQGNFAYKVTGGASGDLYYKNVNRDDWILIANWCFYGLYIVVRYRKPLWLRPMYKCLFTKMNFKSISFEDYSIELTGSNGEILRSRRFRLSPPSAFKRVMSEQFGYNKEQIQSLKAEIGLD